MTALAHPGLDLLVTAVVLLDADLRIVDLNSSAEGLLAISKRGALGQALARIIGAGPGFADKLRQAIAEGRGFRDQDMPLRLAGTEELIHVDCLVTPSEGSETRLVLELRSIDQQLRVEREATQFTLSQANRELVRNLAHEIKNPLGGLRGSAQLLERELDRADLREYTQVIIKEADRLQGLMERLLTPARLPRMAAVNVHEVCERVRSLILAEFPRGVSLRRDYDVSLPELQADREQLIQAVLNVARNAAQAISAAREREGSGEITLRTRAVHQVTIGRQACRLALELQVIDDGPGIPAALRERIFYPLVSGREGGTGLGLTLAMGHIADHHGLIECDSRPGRTVFRILLPVPERSQGVCA